MANRKNSLSDALSRGQQKRVAIVRALTNHPQLILVDELTGEFDTRTSRQIYYLFRSLVQQEGFTILITSHDPLTTEVADLIYELKDGEMEIVDRNIKTLNG